MKTSKQTIFCLFFVFALSFHSLCQKQILGGLNVNADLYSGIIRPSAGILLETNFAKHSGLETGLFYRTTVAHGIFTYAVPTGVYQYPFQLRQKFLNIPVLYRYNTKWVTISIGPTLDFYSGWKQIKGSPQVQIGNYDIHPALQVGLLSKLSKAFVLRERFVIEPEIRFGFLRTFDDGGAGLGVSGKYRF